jgi:hypothetical protein
VGLSAPEDADAFAKTKLNKYVPSGVVQEKRFAFLTQYIFVHRHTHGRMHPHFF